MMGEKIQLMEFDHEPDPPWLYKIELDCRTYKTTALDRRKSTPILANYLEKVFFDLLRLTSMCCKFDSTNGS